MLYLLILTRTWQNVEGKEFLETVLPIAEGHIWLFSINGGFKSRIFYFEN